MSGAGVSLTRVRRVVHRSVSDPAMHFEEVEAERVQSKQRSAHGLSEVPRRGVSESSLGEFEVLLRGFEDLPQVADVHVIHGSVTRSMRANAGCIKRLVIDGERVRLLVRHTAKYKGGLKTPNEVGQ